MARREKRDELALGVGNNHDVDSLRGSEDGGPIPQSAPRSSEEWRIARQMVAEEGSRLSDLGLVYLEDSEDQRENAYLDGYHAGILGCFVISGVCFVMGALAGWILSVMMFS